MTKTTRTASLAGKVALVTGAGAGIGRASVERLAAEGASVIAADIDEGFLRELRTFGGITALPLNVTDAAAVEAAGRSLGRVDVLFNCAGIVPDGTVLDGHETDWQRAFEINVTACYRMIKAFLPAMIEAGGGSIINMASVVSSLKGAPRRFAYGASKAAVIGMTKSVAADFVTYGIRCNAICPGTVDTPSLQARLQATGNYDAARSDFIARQPMGRLARAEEIAAMVAYLAGDEAAFVTGQAFAIDGGWSG